jgi:streptogramin lyase/DNA-directed RNA polymerase subunit RPC12/RpoP
MTANELNCPKCGGTIKIDSDADLTTHCPYCNSLVEIPERMRNHSNKEVLELLNKLGQEGQKTALSYRSKVALFIAIGGITFIAVLTWAIITAVKGSSSTSAAISEDIAASPTLDAPTLTPTPNFAFVISSFGQSGIGEGYFNNPRQIAVDGSGNIYVADYDNGRVQRFSTDGTYLSSWSVSEDDVHIQGVASTYDGYVFVSYGDEIKKFYGPSGEWITTIANPKGGDYGDLAVTIDGNLVVVWYESRWGLITSIEGHGESLCVFDKDGNPIQEYPSFISGMTESPQYDILLAVDGNGMIYAVSESKIFVFNKNGEFVDRFLPGNGQEDYSPWVNDIAVDGQGRIYVLESYTIHVLSPQYQFLDNIPVEDSLNVIAIDAQNNIWGLSSTQVFELHLRSK